MSFLSYAKSVSKPNKHLGSGSKTYEIRQLFPTDLAQRAGSWTPHSQME